MTARCLYRRGSRGTVLILIMRWPEVWGEGGVSWSYWILGERNLWGLSGTFSQPWSENVVPELCSLWSV